MTVYIDCANLSYGRMTMCHMAADNLEELHEMAERIGLRREWFQAGRIPHYDVSLSKKRLSIKYGAVEVDSKTLLSVVGRGIGPRKRI